MRELAFKYNGDISFDTFIAVSCITEMQLKSMSTAEASLVRITLFWEMESIGLSEKSNAQSDLYKLSVSFEAFACLLSPFSVI